MLDSVFFLNNSNEITYSYLDVRTNLVALTITYVRLKLVIKLVKFFIFNN